MFEKVDHRYIKVYSFNKLPSISYCDNDVDCNTVYVCYASIFWNNLL